MTFKVGARRTFADLEIASFATSKPVLNKISVSNVDPRLVAPIETRVSNILIRHQKDKSREEANRAKLKDIDKFRARCRGLTWKARSSNATDITLSSSSIWSICRLK